jgi:hypothetical protein
LNRNHQVCIIKMIRYFSLRILKSQNNQKKEMKILSEMIARIRSKMKKSKCHLILSKNNSLKINNKITSLEVKKWMSVN